MSGSRGRAMVFSYQSIPLGACVVVLCFEGEVDFCNKYMSSFWTNVSPWTYAHLSFYFASLYYYHATLAGIEPFIYLPQNSHHTYLLWHFHSHSEIYCHATFHRSVYYDTFYHCHIALCMIM